MNILILLFLLVIIIISIFFGIAALRKMRNWGLVLIGLVVLIGIVFVLCNTVWYNNNDKVEIMNASNQEFSIKVDNHKLSYQYFHSRFSCKYSIDELLKLVQKQYSNTYWDDTLNAILIIENNNIYALENEDVSDFLGSKRYHYVFFYNSLSIDINKITYDIPFPSNLITETLNDDKTEVYIKADFKTLKKYYETFTNVSFTDNTIEIQQENKKYIITVDDRKVHFKVE